MGFAVVSEGPVRITKTTVEAAWKRRAGEQRIMVRDKECRGLALVVNPTSMAWRFDYRPRGVDPITGKRFTNKSVTIGGPASHSPDEARAAANRLKDTAKGGADPAAERKAQRDACAKERSATTAKLVDAYAADLPARPKMRGNGLPSAAYVSTELAHLRSAVATMRAEDRTIGAIGAADLRGLLRAEASRSAVARHRFGAVSRFFDWALDEGHVAVNPCAQISKGKRPRPPAARSRYLTPAAIGDLWKAAAGMEFPVHRDYARFLMAIPCRRNEAARMDWAHVDLDGASWAQPDKLTKNGDPHRLHLPPLALDILRARHEAAGQPKAGYVFPAPRVKDRPLTTFSAIKVELDKLAVMDAWAWHDFRRSFATALGEAGIPEAVADAVLNHRQAATRGGVLGVYQRAERWGERKAALEAWAALLAPCVAAEAESATTPEAA